MRVRRLTQAKSAEPGKPKPDLAAGQRHQFAASGEANLDDESRVVAVAGLSLITARHAFLLAGRVLHTWCAWDAVGGWCQSPIVVELSGGGVVGEPFQPAATAASMLAEVQGFANLLFAAHWWDHGSFGSMAYYVPLSPRVPLRVGRLKKRGDVESHVPVPGNRTYRDFSGWDLACPCISRSSFE